MNKIQCKKIIEYKIKELTRALYKGEYGTPESEEVEDRENYIRMVGYLYGLEKALFILTEK